MKATITAVDLAKGGAVITFGDGVAVFFIAEFLWMHRNDQRNQRLPAESVEE